jgi:hypothetical protein
VPVSEVEVVARVERRRKWTAEETRLLDNGRLAAKLASGRAVDRFQIAEGTLSRVKRSAGG